MCGIAGFFDKTDIGRVPAGATLLRMLTALSCRGPDSAGIALWGPGDDGLIVRVKLGDGGDLEARRREVLRRARRATRVQASAIAGRAPPSRGREDGARGAGRRDRERGPRRRGREHGATARDREAGRRAGRPRRRVRRLHLDRHPRPRPHAPVDGEPGRPLPLPALLGSRDARSGRGAQRAHLQLPPAPPDLRAGGRALLHGERLRDHRPLPGPAARRRPDAGRGAPGLDPGSRRELQLPGRDRRRVRLRQGPLQPEAADRRGERRAPSPSPTRRSRSRPRSGAATGRARPGRAPPGCGSSRAGRRGGACGASAGSREMAAIDCAPPLRPRDQPVHPAADRGRGARDRPPEPRRPAQPGRGHPHRRGHHHRRTGGLLRRRHERRRPAHDPRVGGLGPRRVPHVRHRRRRRQRRERRGRLDPRRHRRRPGGRRRAGRASR